MACPTVNNQAMNAAIGWRAIHPGKPERGVSRAGVEMAVVDMTPSVGRNDMAGGSLAGLSLSFQPAFRLRHVRRSPRVTT